MKITELFEANPQVAGTMPGVKVGETPPGARPTGDFPTPVTQGPPNTSNTPKTPVSTGFTPAAKAPTLGATPVAPSGTSDTTVPPTDVNQPTAAQPQPAPADNNQGMEQELESLKAMIRQMQGQLTAPSQQPK